MKTINSFLTACLLSLAWAAPAVADPTIYWNPYLSVNSDNTCSLDDGQKTWTIPTPTAPNKIQYVIGTSAFTAKDWLDFKNQTATFGKKFPVESIKITYDGPNVTYVFITISD
jgi:hypothetical protein